MAFEPICTCSLSRLLLDLGVNSAWTCKVVSTCSSGNRMGKCEHRNECV